MNPATMQTIGAERIRDMREQAAAWRRARLAHGGVRARSPRVSFATVVRNARSLAVPPG